MDCAERDREHTERTRLGRVIGPLHVTPPDAPVLLVEGTGGSALYPAFQFTDGGKRRQDIEDVVRNIRDESPTTDLEIAHWLRTPLESLDGMTPEAGLAAGDPTYGRVFALVNDFAWAARESMFM